MWLNRCSPSFSVDRRKSKHKQRSHNEDKVERSQGQQATVDARPHLRPREYDNRHSVPQDAKYSNHRQRYAVDVESERVYQLLVRRVVFLVSRRVLVPGLVVVRGSRAVERLGAVVTV